MTLYVDEALCNDANKVTFILGMSEILQKKEKKRGWLSHSVLGAIYVHAEFHSDVLVFKDICEG